MADEKLKDFNLVGDTSLSLQMGHRMSIDLDLFSTNPFSVEELKDHLSEKFNYEITRTHPNTLITKIDDIKVDFITYNYPLINELILEDGIRLYSMEDISAMKLSAIANSGTKLKDFIDLACLSTNQSFSHMLDCFEKKFPNVNTMHIIRSVGYHEDIMFAEKVKMINSEYNWDLTKNRIHEMIKNPDKVFMTLPVKNDLNIKLKNAALKNDFNSITQIKEKGFVYSPAINNNLKNAGVLPNTMIAIQKIFSFESGLDTLKDIKLASGGIAIQFGENR